MNDEYYIFPKLTGLHTFAQSYGTSSYSTDTYAQPAQSNQVAPVSHSSSSTPPAKDSVASNEERATPDPVMADQTDDNADVAQPTTTTAVSTPASAAPPTQVDIMPLTIIGVVSAAVIFAVVMALIKRSRRKRDT